MTDAPTIRDIWDEHRLLVLSDIAPRTVYGYERAWVRDLGESLGSESVDALTGLKVRIAWNSWAGSESTKTDTLALLNRIMRVCVEAGLIPVNPAHGLRLKRGRDAKTPSRRALSLAELQLFLFHVPEGPYRWACEALAYTGCRLGEIAGLMPVDVHLDESLIDVSRSNSPDRHGRLVMGPTKARRARFVPIIPQMRRVLDKVMTDKGPTDLIFTGPRGGAVDSSNLARAIGLTEWRDQVKQYPPGEDPLHLHDLRHTAFTIMAEAGATVLDIKAIAGHSTVKVTEHYARPGIAAARRVGEAYGAALRSYVPKEV